LIVSGDKTTIISILDRTNHTYGYKRSKQVEVDSHVEKRPFTSIISTSLSSNFLSTQSVYIECCASVETKGHIFSTNSSNHWYSLITMKVYFKEIIFPYYSCMVLLNSIPTNLKVIIYIDFWKSH
ncbi:hypothetical protein C7212DRAFT_115757, partial [Tuber magnatum]